MKSENGHNSNSSFTARVWSILLPLATILLPLTSQLLLLNSCTSIDCPVQNRVYTVYNLVKSDATTDTIEVDTLTITSHRANGTDTTLLNRLSRFTTYELDISYSQPEDTFFYELRDTLGGVYLDTVWIKKENTPHFESVDCQATFFHRLTAVRSTHNIIDTIRIINPIVNYDASIQHFNIHFKARY